ncbi:MAG: DNA primase [Thiotrichales bacterium 35-46-9]|nr:MAG: DNA primase [Thiotrichales bacterium 35-46-9]
MAGRIPKTFIDDLVARADVVEVVGRRITLKKAGREYKACCPFHNEKTPSFQINPQKGFYHCFGCGAHGDALRFIMDYEHLDFVSAIEVLASEMGVSVPREQVSAQQQAKEIQQRSEQLQGFALLAQAAQWFVHNLKHHAQGAQAIEYLKSRGVTGVVARDFAIGLAPNESMGLQKQFPNVTKAQWLAVGLVAEREDGSVVDKFRNRIQFPIRDLRGRVVGFGGRIMQASEHAPKYLNSPETEFFHKGNMLYGLYEMLQSVRNINRVLVVEGYMDVVALAQFGVRQVVATLGTATTPAHLQLLFKHTSEIVFAFDGDKAGRKAAWKALSVALTQLSGSRSVKFFFLPQDEDPDSYVRRYGAEALMQALDQSLTPGEWLVQGLADLSGLSWSVAEDARRLLFQSAQWLKQTEEMSVRYALIQSLAQAADMQEWQVEKLLGVRTGLAVHRDLKKKQLVAPALATQKLSDKLLALLTQFPQLAEDWPSQDAALLHQYGEKGVMALLTALAGNLPTNASASLLPFTIEQAKHEWQDGWQLLVCKAIETARLSMLKQMEQGQSNESLLVALSKLNQRVKLCQTRAQRQ